MLRENDFFSNMTKEEQDVTYQNIYTYLVVVQNVIKIIGGYVLDVYGTWLGRSIFQTVMVIGAICGCFMAPDKTYLVYLNELLYIPACFPIFNNVLGFSRIFPKYKAFFSTLLQAANAVSQIWMYIYTRDLIDQQQYTNLMNFYV